MKGSVAFANHRLSVLMNRFGWLMLVIWLAVTAVERYDRAAQFKAEMQRHCNLTD